MAERDTGEQLRALWQALEAPPLGAAMAEELAVRRLRAAWGNLRAPEPPGLETLHQASRRTQGRLRAQGRLLGAAALAGLAAAALLLLLLLPVGNSDSLPSAGHTAHVSTTPLVVLQAPARVVRASPAQGSLELRHGRTRLILLDPWPSKREPAAPRNDQTPRPSGPQHERRP